MAFVIRMAEKKDLQALYILSGSANLSSLPNNKKIIKQIIDNSLKSTVSKSKKKIGKRYLFILEDIKKKKLIGTGQIQAQKTHDKRANYTFQIIKEKKHSHSLDVSLDHSKLKLIEDYEPLTELGGLLIDKAYHGSPHKLGKLLSYSRFFYISQFSNLFSKRLYAEIVPKTYYFWKYFSSKFIPLNFYQADLFSRENQEFFSSLLPKEDIYLSLLPKKLANNIAKPSPSGKKSMHLLKKAGFVFLNTVDPFDAGPCLHGQIKNLPFHNKYFKAKIYDYEKYQKEINTKANSQANSQANTQKNTQKKSEFSSDEDKYFLISSGSGQNFRCVLIRPKKISILKEKIKIYCKQSILDSLKVKSGKIITYYIFKKK